MKRRYSVFRCAGRAAIAMAFTAGLAAQAVHAQGLRYQDANELASEGPVNLTPPPGMTIPDVIVSTLPDPMQVPPPNEDSKWNFRNFGADTTVYESGIAEDSPYLTQTLTGLTAGNSYDLYAVYWTDEDENWTIRTGLTPSNMTLYSWTGANGGSFPVAGSTQGIAASSAPWVVLPPPTKEPTATTYFVERLGDPLVMLLGYAGTAVANGSGQIDVVVDDNPIAGAVRRTWFDGVAYADAGSQLTVTASLDRTTGAMSITNSSSQPLQIKSYRITHANSEVATNPVTGTVNSTTWTTVSSTTPSWTVTSPATPSAFATTLSEEGPSNPITLAANGGTLNFGNVWNRSPLDQMLVYLTLGDDHLAVLAPSYTGPAIANGDLDGNGSLDLADFQTFLNNLHTTLPTMPALTRVETYRRGELVVDGAINFSDWAAFRTAFNAANGEGAFEAMLAQIPEPSTLALLVMMGIAASIFATRRVGRSCLAVTMCIMLADTSSAATLLKVDVNSRAGEPATPAPPGDNTVPGFGPYTMQTGTTGPLGTSTNTVNGYTITLTAVNAAGGPMGVFDDRDRATPTTAPTLNQLYDDFIFAHGSGTTSTGEGGGLDVAINSGGALTPNTDYAVSIYAFDTGSTGVLRSADWLDGNSGNAAVMSTAFLGAFSPPTDDEFRFDGLFRTDGSGNLLLRARETTVGTHGVFLNGFEIADQLPPPPAKLTLEVNTTTGAVSIVNPQSVSIDVSYYELRSAAGSLNMGNWSSLDDAEMEDPLGDGWDEAPLSSANLLSEVNLRSMLSLGQGGSANLGTAFSVGATQDLQLLYAAPNAMGLRRANISYVTGPSPIPGDFNGDNAVNAADYVVWRKTDGTPTGYDLWRTNFGRTSGSEASLAAGAAVPEPGTMLLSAFGVALLMMPVRRQSGRPRCTFGRA